jgi:hypothetical protein
MLLRVEKTRLLERAGRRGEAASGNFARPSRICHLMQTNEEVGMGWRAYGYAWITLGFLAFSMIGHWVLGWFTYVSEQEQHQAPIVVADYFMVMGRDTLENWQSEFLQLLWQVGGLAMFLYVGSPQSRESDDRKEAKLDAILRQLDPNRGEEVIRQLDLKYQRR